MLIFVFHTSASDCLENRLRNDLYCVEQDVKPYSLTHSLLRTKASSLGTPFKTRDFCYCRLI